MSGRVCVEGEGGASRAAAWVTVTRLTQKITQWQPLLSFSLLFGSGDGGHSCSWNFLCRRSGKVIKHWTTLRHCKFRYITRTGGWRERFGPVGLFILNALGQKQRLLVESVSSRDIPHLMTRTSSWKAWSTFMRILAEASIYVTFSCLASCWPSSWVTWGWR